MVANSACSSNSSTLEAALGCKDVEQSNSSVITYQSSILPTLRQNSEYLEVDYRNITSLYVSIEDCDWEAVSQKCKLFPDDVRTWVVSGSEGECSFSWCVWRRLPIHEACRRLPPMQVVQDLLHLFPESANEKTQFGELPLHLAAGCGASWNVVNLLLAYNPWAVAVPDGGGRTPVELVQKGGMSPECGVIVEALTNCDKMIVAGNRKINSLIDQMKFEREEEVGEMKRRQEIENRNNKQQISLLQTSAEKSRKLINDLVSSVNLCEERVMQKNVAEEKWMQRVSDLEKDNSELRVYIQKLKGVVTKVEDERDEKKRRIYDLNEVVTKMVCEMDSVMNEQKGASAQSIMLEKEIEELNNRQRLLNLNIVKQRENMKALSLTAVIESEEILIEEKLHNIAIDKHSVAIIPSGSTPVGRNIVTPPFTPPKLQNDKSTIEQTATEILDSKKDRLSVVDNNNDGPNNMINVINALSEFSPIPKDNAYSKEEKNSRYRQHHYQLPPRLPRVIQGDANEHMNDISAFSTLTEDEDEAQNNIGPRFIVFSKTTSTPPLSPFPPMGL